MRCFHYVGAKLMVMHNDCVGGGKWWFDRDAHWPESEDMMCQRRCRASKLPMHWSQDGRAVQQWNFETSQTNCALIQWCRCKVTMEKMLTLVWRCRELRWSDEINALIVIVEAWC